MWAAFQLYNAAVVAQVSVVTGACAIRLDVALVITFLTAVKSSPWRVTFTDSRPVWFHLTNTVVAARFAVTDVGVASGPFKSYGTFTAWLTCLVDGANTTVFAVVIADRFTADAGWAVSYFTLAKFTCGLINTHTIGRANSRLNTAFAICRQAKVLDSTLAATPTVRRSSNAVTLTALTSTTIFATSTDSTVFVEIALLSRPNVARRTVAGIAIDTISTRKSVRARFTTARLGNTIVNLHITVIAFIVWITLASPTGRSIIRSCLIFTLTVLTRVVLTRIDIRRQTTFRI